MRVNGKDRVGLIITTILICTFVLLCSHIVQSAKTKPSPTTSTTKEEIPNINIDNFGEVYFISVEHYLQDDVAYNLTKTGLSVEVGDSVSKKLSKIKNVRESFLHTDPFGNIYQIEDFSKTTQSLMMNGNKDGKLPPLTLDLVFEKTNPSSDNATQYLNIVTPVVQILNNEDNMIAYCVGRAASKLLSNQVTLQVLADLYGKVSTDYLSSKFAYEVSKNAYEKELAVYNPIVKRLNSAIDNIKKLIQTNQELVQQQ